MQGLCTHVSGHAAQVKRFGSHVISERKSALVLFDRHPVYRAKWGDRHLLVGDYYVATVGNVNEETILNYIRVQEENEKPEDGGSREPP